MGEKLKITSKAYLSLSYKVTTKAVYIVSLIFLGAIILFGEFALGLFDSSFVVAFIPLIIVSIANVCSAAIGVTGYINVIYGNSRIEMNNTFIAVIVSIVFNVILIPKIGILGASISFLLSSLALNALRVVITKRKYELHPFDKEYIILPIIYLGVILVIRSSTEKIILSIFIYIIVSIIILAYFGIRNKKLIYRLIKTNIDC